MTGARRFSVDVAWNVAGLAVAGSGGILANLLVLSVCGAEALGLFNLVFAIYLIVSQVAVGGVQYSVISHYARSVDPEREGPALVSSAVALVFLLGAVIAAAVYAAAPAIAAAMDKPGVAAGLRMAAPGLLFFAVNKALLMAVNARRHMRMFAVFQSLRCLLLIASLAVLAAVAPPEWLAAALTLTEAVLLVVLLLYTGLRVCPLSWRCIDRAWLRRHAGFGMRGFLTGVLGEMNTRVDVIMLGFFAGNAMIGVYSFSAMLAEGFAQLSVVVRQNMDPLIGRYFAQGTLAELPALTRRVRRVFVPVMVALAVLISAGYAAVLWWFDVPPMWRTGGVVLAILLGALAANAAYRPFLGILIQGGRPGVNTVLVAALVMANILLNAVLIPWFGLPGAAVATGMVCVAEAVAIRMLARRLWGITL